MDVVFGVLAIIAVIAAIYYWPITLCLIGVYIIYRIYRKNELNNLDQELKDKEKSLISTQNELKSVEEKKDQLNEKLNSNDTESQRLRTVSAEITRFMTFFSALSQAPLSIESGIQTLNYRIGEQNISHIDLELQYRELADRSVLLQQRSQRLCDEISFLKEQINSRKKK